MYLLLAQLSPTQSKIPTVLTLVLNITLTL